MECADTRSEIATLVQGDDRDLYLRVLDRDTSTPYDLTGVGEIKARFRKQDDTALEKTLSAGGVSVVAATSGRLVVSLTSADTVLLRAREAQDFEIEIMANSKTVVVQFLQALTVRGRVV